MNVTGVSERSQIVVIWWALAFAVLYGISFALLLRMLPPPDPTYTAVQVAQWYANRAGSIRWGATATSFFGAFALPLWAVIAVQISRQERGRPIWAVVSALGGALVSLALSIPTLFIGVAAFATDRAPDVTALMHQLGVLTFVTDVQWNPFAFIPVIVVCFLPQTAPYSPFPRWYAYFTIWATMMFEVGPLAFNTRTGPFAWNGLLVFWVPAILFTIWIAATSRLLLGALNHQRDAALA